MSNTTCNQCGAHIRWFQNKRGTWLPFNIEDIDDNFDPQTADCHWKTCRRNPGPDLDLNYEQRRRPGYL